MKYTLQARKLKTPTPLSVGIVRIEKHTYQISHQGENELSERARKGLDTYFFQALREQAFPQTAKLELTLEE